MANFCRNCGGQLAADAKFCAACGATVEPSASPPPQYAAPPAAPQYAAPPPPYYPQQQKPNIWPWVAAMLALLIVVLGAVYFARQGSEETTAQNGASAVVPPGGGAVTPPAAGTAVAQPAAQMGPRVTLYVVSDANVRTLPTAQDANSKVLSTLKRGTQVTGNMQIGANGKARWFKLADNTGYISAVNLNEALTAAPAVAQAPASVPGAIYCTVVDRTGSNLRVRATPNGRVTGGMPHGTRLRVLGEQMDDAGVNWVNVDPDGAYPTGWVSGAFISC